MSDHTNQLGSNTYAPIAVSDESTVVAEFIPDPKAATRYQSEADLERELIAMLQQQAYEYLPITSSADLEANLRTQLEALNKITFSDREWKHFFTEKIASKNDGIVEKTKRIQEDHVQILKRDDGSTKNVTLIDKQNIHNNRLQVVNQYETVGAHANRYDVTILVNGLPLVHIELKRRGVDLREAFNQINRYQRDSFWADSGLFEYVQLFVISNGTLTKYYSNTTRDRHVNQAQGQRRSKQQSSNTYEFTSWWTDAANNRITDLTGFAKTFFAKHALLNVLTRYCVFDTDQNLLVMRPYQIVATEKILERVAIAGNDHKRLGTPRAGGYVWHTTGSGKTLTSFKTAQLATRMPGVDKVLFVVDRKDLDYQTMKEFNRFEEGAVNGSTNTGVLARHLADPTKRIIVTTIQKLARFVSMNKQHDIYGGRVVIIFDECHRSQFGDMHRDITRAFRKYHLFGFTGTPIFADNAGSSGDPNRRTTEQIFGDKLHTYTIVDAIGDKNVLPFRLDYVNTIKVADSVTDKQVTAIDTERALSHPARIDQVANYVLDHFDQKTKRTRTYKLGDTRVSGFNSIFAAASIDAAKAYYSAFERLQRDREAAPTYRRLKIAIIYTYQQNEAEPDEFFGTETVDPVEEARLEQSSQSFLEDAMTDYNVMFDMNFSTGGDGFDGYYKDIAKRLKNRDLDMVIVVNMFLTGFDATTLNTLWVDKNLHSHGLVQAYSRTNRILNSVKTYGNIVTFRDLEQATNDALALFGNKDARGIALLRSFDEYFEEYRDLVAELIDVFPVGLAVVGEAAQKEFVSLFGMILKLRNILSSFDDFEAKDMLAARHVQDYTSVYLDIYNERRKDREAEREAITDDLVFEIELVKQVEVNVDYILLLVRQYLDKQGTGADQEVRATIARAIDSSPSLRSKRDLIEAFVETLTVGADVDDSWQEFVAKRRDAELAAIVAEERLNPEATEQFVANAFRDGAIPTSGTSVVNILPPTSRFADSDDHGSTKQAVLARLGEYFERFFDLGG